MFCRWTVGLGRGVREWPVCREAQWRAAGHRESRAHMELEHRLRKKQGGAPESPPWPALQASKALLRQLHPLSAAGAKNSTWCRGERHIRFSLIEKYPSAVWRMAWRNTGLGSQDCWGLGLALSNRDRGGTIPRRCLEGRRYGQLWRERWQ